jgi:hypothetical protein
MPDLVAILAGARLHLGLTRTSLSLIHMPNGWQRKPVPLLEATLDDPVGLAEPLAPALAEGRFTGLPLSVTLGDDCVRLFMVEPPKNAISLQDIQAAAAMRFHRLYGDDPGGWVIDCAASADRPFLACALPTALAGAIRAVARGHGLRLASVAPLFVVSWNQLRSRLGRAWLGVVQSDSNGDSITLGCVGGGADPDLVAVHRIHPPGGQSDAAWLRHQVRAAAMRFGLDDPAELKVFGGGLALPSVADGLAITRLDPLRGGRLQRQVFIPMLGQRRTAT